MTDDRHLTRRKAIGIGATAIGGLLAGCTGDPGPAAETTGAGDGDVASGSTTAPEPTESTDTATPEASSYSVAIEPVGDATFESVPETWVANNGSWADMGIALGLEPPEGVYLPSRYHTRYYDAVDGVSVDGSAIQKLWGEGGVGKEQFYELDADVHVMDPNFLLNRGNWSQSDVDEIATNVGPFFGNSIFSRTYPWHEGYRYFTLYEAFGKLAEVFQRTGRYEAFASLHEEFQSALGEVVPAEGECPAVAVVWGGGDQPEQFYPYVLSEARASSTSTTSA